MMDFAERIVDLIDYQDDMIIRMAKFGGEEIVVEYQKKWYRVLIGRIDDDE
jgi:hypothetical protein